MFGEQLMRATRLQDAPKRLTKAIRDVESELAAMRGGECAGFFLSTVFIHSWKFFGIN
jgi:hypothetical protein